MAGGGKKAGSWWAVGVRAIERTAAAGLRSMSGGVLNTCGKVRTLRHRSRLTKTIIIILYVVIYLIMKNYVSYSLETELNLLLYK